MNVSDVTKLVKIRIYQMQILTFQNSWHANANLFFFGQNVMHWFGSVKVISCH